MLELTEAVVLAKQLNESIRGKKVKNVIAAGSQHKFAWFYKDPQSYPGMLTGKIVGDSKNYGGHLEITVEDTVLLFSDGATLRYFETNEKRPLKHQLFIEFEDLSSLCVTIQMYGGIWCFPAGEFDNPYYLIAKEKPSPLSDRFDEAYFYQMINATGMDKLSAKAFLATEQRIPGLGNGVLQDILYYAGIHPKKKVKEFEEDEKRRLYHTLRTTLQEMIRLGGRDTEKDLFGNPGGYKTNASKNTVDQPCPSCGSLIKKEAYLGGSIYYCGGCQSM
jgi:formamidopyrimidine-DNA glycosylase